PLKEEDLARQNHQRANRCRNRETRGYLGNESKSCRDATLCGRHPGCSRPAREESQKMSSTPQLRSELYWSECLLSGPCGACPLHEWNSAPNWLSAFAVPISCQQSLARFRTLPTGSHAARIPRLALGTRVPTRRAAAQGFWVWCV